MDKKVVKPATRVVNKGTTKVSTVKRDNGPPKAKVASTSQARNVKVTDRVVKPTTKSTVVKKEPTQTTNRIVTRSVSKPGPEPAKRTVTKSPAAKQPAQTTALKAKVAPKKTNTPSPKARVINSKTRTPSPIDPDLSTKSPSPVVSPIIDDEPTTEKAADNEQEPQQTTEEHQEPLVDEPTKKDVPQFTVRPPTSNVRAHQESPSEESLRMARPTTARAAPPKILRKQEIEEANHAIELEEQKRLAAAKPVANLITESRDEDEDENFVIDHQDVAENETLVNKIGIGGEQQQQKGSLLKHLIETKNELEGEHNVASGADEPMSRLAIRDVDKLRQSIQTLSRLANPLGRVLEYLQEDIDTMFAELKTWRDETEVNQRKLENERSSIDTDLIPLRSTLESLDQEISDQIEKISNTKANIIKNEEKFVRMLTMVVEKA